MQNIVLIAQRIMRSLPSLPWESPLKIEDETMGKLVATIGVNGVKWTWTYDGREHEILDHDRKALDKDALSWVLDQMADLQPNLEELCNKIKDLIYVS